MEATAKLAITRRLRSLSHAAERLGCDAQTLVGTLLRLWCSKEFRALPQPSLPHSKSLASAPEAFDFLAILSREQFLASTYWLSSAYAIHSAWEYRKKLAMFFTPSSLSDGLLDAVEMQGIDFGTASFMDPACGGGAFLAPIALRMRNALIDKGLTAKDILHHVEAHLRGRDLDGTLCELSKNFLRMALYEEIQKAKYLPSFDVQPADSLTQLATLHGTVDVVVCNPPYRKMTAEELAPLCDIYADVIEAQPNIYCLFIELCILLLRAGGNAALVTPTSFLTGHSFRRLRKFIMRSTSVRHIGIVSSRLGVFIDVEQETALTLLRRREEVCHKQIQAQISVVSVSGKYTSVGKSTLPNTGGAWPIPRSAQDVTLLKAASLSKFRLVDYGYLVRVGAYVWNRDKRPKFHSLIDARRAKSYTAVPLIWSRDIASGGIVHLERVSVRDGEHRFVDLGDDKHSSVITSQCVVLQRVTSNDQPRRLVAATVSPDIFQKYGGFVGENHVIIIEPMKHKPLLSPVRLAQLLSTHVFDRIFRCISGSTNVSAFELNQLALPDPPSLIDAIKNTKSMDDAVRKAFGLSFED